MTRFGEIHSGKVGTLGVLEVSFIHQHQIKPNEDSIKLELLVF